MATEPKDQLNGNQRRLIADQTGKPSRTLYDAFVKKGLIGCIHSGSGDLSTNPKHMEGFGKDVWPENSD